MTQRIEPFPQNDSKILFTQWLSERYCFVYFDSNKNRFQNTTQNWTFLIDWFWSKGLFFLFSKTFEHERMTQRIETQLFPKNWNSFWMTHRIELFFGMWLKELNRIFKKLTQRIEPRRLKEFFFTKWLKELNLFSQSMTFNNWTFWKIWLKELTCFKMTQRIEPFPFFVLWMTLLERYCFVYFDSNNWTVFKIRPKGLNFFDWLINMIQRIVFSLMSHRIEHFFWTRKNWTFFFHDAKNWTHFLERLNWTLFRSKELNILFEYDSQNWTLFWNVTQRIETFSKDWTF